MRKQILENRIRRRTRKYDIVLLWAIVSRRLLSAFARFCPSGGFQAVQCLGGWSEDQWKPSEIERSSERQLHLSLLYLVVSGVDLLRRVACGEELFLSDRLLLNLLRAGWLHS